MCLTQIWKHGCTPLVNHENIFQWSPVESTIPGGDKRMHPKLSAAWTKTKKKVFFNITTFATVVILNLSRGSNRNDLYICSVQSANHRLSSRFANGTTNLKMFFKYCFLSVKHIQCYLTPYFYSN